MSEELFGKYAINMRIKILSLELHFKFNSINYILELKDVFEQWSSTCSDSEITNELQDRVYNNNPTK